MKELKFRIWDKKKKKMHYDIAQWWDIFFVEEAMDDYVIMQFICMQDEDSKDVYEEDIIKGMHDFGPGGWAKRKGIIGWRTCGYEMQYWSHFKVIGNTFESSDIMSGT